MDSSMRGEIEMDDKEKLLEDDTYVCKECCASNVEEQVWVKINSYNGHMAEVVGDGGDNFFCPECGETVAVIQYCDFAVEDDTEAEVNNRLNQIVSEADVAMNRFIKRITEEGNEDDNRK